MRSTAFWRRRIATALSDDDAYRYDLLSQLNYMAAVASSGASRDAILDQAGRQPLRTAPVFRNVFLLVKRMGLEYSRAYQVVAESAPSESLRHLLLRFSGASATGGSEAEFIREELRVEMERYTAQYERSAESLRKWTEAYASLLVSASLIVVVAVVSTMLYHMQRGFLAALGLLMVGIVGLGVYVIYRVAPVEKMATTTGGGRHRRLARKALLVCGSAGVAGAVLAYPRAGLGGALLVIGLSLVPTGVLAWLDSGVVTGFDRDLPNMIRAVGFTAAALGTSVGASLEKIDRRALGSLDAPVRRLQWRLSFSLDPDACWQRLVHETGSELVGRTTQAFLDAVKLGAPPDRAVDVCAEFAMGVALMRAKRSLTASTFTYLSVALHAAMVGLLMFVLQIVLQFNARVAALATEVMGQMRVPGAMTLTDLPFFTSKDMAPLILMIHAMVLVLTVANALAPKAAAGGHSLGVFSYAAATFTLSGVAVLLVPAVTTSLFRI